MSDEKGFLSGVSPVIVSLKDPEEGECNCDVCQAERAMRAGKVDEAYALVRRGLLTGPTDYERTRQPVAQWLMNAPEQSFDDIVGNEEALSQLRDAILAPVAHAELYEAYGMKPPKGVLLSGPPGCGKTMFARAAASEMKRLYGKQVEFLCLSATELQSKYVGETEKLIKAIFAFARTYKNKNGHPLLVFIDEAETFLPDRNHRPGRYVQSWEQSQVATFLAEMDGIAESAAFVMLATNRPHMIDQALLRDGRCDFKIEVKRPTPEAAETILRRRFASTFTRCDRELLVAAAVDSIYDPHKVLIDAHLLGVNVGTGQVEDLHHQHFLLEHIVSGAMVASIPERSTRFAFARDKAAGKPTGVTVEDVVRAVTAIYEENKKLDHSFALGEFKSAFMETAMKKGRDHDSR